MMASSVESGRYSYTQWRPPTGFVNGNGRSFRPGDVSYVVPTQGSYYQEKPNGYAFFYSESRFPGIPSLPRVPPGLESLQQAPQPKYPTAHPGVDITNAIFNPGKISRHDVESERYFTDIAAESPLAMVPPNLLPLPGGVDAQAAPRMEPPMVMQQVPYSSYLARPYETVIYGPPSGGYGGANVPQQSQPASTVSYIDKGASTNPEPQQPRSATSTPFSTLGGLFNAAWADMPQRPVRQTNF